MITCLRLYNDQVALFREAQRHQTVGAWRSGSAPALGAGGRKFEPCRPDHTATKLKQSSQKCRGFSRSYSKVTPIRPDKCLNNCRFGHPSTHARESGREVLEVSGCCPLRVRTSCAVRLRLSSRDRIQRVADTRHALRQIGRWVSGCCWTFGNCG